MGNPITAIDFKIQMLKQIFQEKFFFNWKWHSILWNIGDALKYYKIYLLNIM